MIRITVACAAAVAVARSETITPLRIPSMPSLSIPFSVTLTTLHTIGTTSHRLFSLGHDGWPFEQFSFSKGSTYTQFFLSLFLFLSCFIYIYIFYRYIYLLIFVLGRNTRDSFASLVREGRISHLFDTKTRHEKKHRIIPRLSASGRSFTVDYQCARATNGQCAESSRSLPF